MSHETLPDDFELPHGTIDGRTVSAHEIAGTMNDSTLVPITIINNDKQKIMKNAYDAQENTAASLEEVFSIWRFSFKSIICVYSCLDWNEN